MEVSGEAEASIPSVQPGPDTDQERALLEPIFDGTGRPGRPAEWSRRRILEAVSYVVRTGCAWRMLPQDFPPWQTAYSCFRRWRDDGHLEQMHHALRRMRTPSQ